MTNSQGNRINSLSKIVTIAKDLFALLRDFAFFAVAFLLIIFPATFNSILTNAGFEEGSFAGLKWKRQLYDSDNALRTAQDTITSLKNQNNELLKALVEAKSVSALNMKQQEKLVKLESETRLKTNAANQVQESVQDTLNNNAPLVAKARIVISDNESPSMAFCYQEDNLKAGVQRYSVHCHSTLIRCNSARGPNPRTEQSLCKKVNLSGVKWEPRHPGWMGSWFEFRKEPFGAPFPTIPQP